MADLSALTPREREIVRAVLDGSTNQAIARTLALREQTVKNYLSSIFDKLRVANRLELALYALDRRPAAGAGDRGEAAADDPGDAAS